MGLGPADVAKSLISSLFDFELWRFCRECCILWGCSQQSRKGRRRFLGRGGLGFDEGGDPELKGGLLPY
jgi:hypothetical protein